MSEERRFLSIRLHLGERFDCIPVPDREISLAQFLDIALKDLESESRIQLPDDDEQDLVDPAHFRVFSDPELSNQLNLNDKLSQIDYLLNCEANAVIPELVLVSHIFRNADQVDRERRANTALRRATGTSPPPVGPPKAPVRTSSLSPKKVTSKEEILYLVGRKPYSPQRPHTFLQESSSSTSLGVNDFVDRLLDNSSSEDSQSLLSSQSGVTMDSVKWKANSLTRPASAHLMHKTLAKTSSDAASIKSTESDGAIEKLRQSRSRSPGSGLAVTSTSVDSADSGVSRARRAHKQLGHTRSLPAQGLSEDPVEVGLREIVEGEELASPRSSQEREVSPLLETPLVPTRAISPSRRKARKFASKRGTSKNSEASRSLDSTSEQDCQTSDSQVAGTSTRRQFKTFYSRKKKVASALFPHRVFGAIKTFRVDFEIPSADICVEMDLRGDFTVGQIKDNLWGYLREQAGLAIEETGSLWDPENFTLSYTMGTETYELYDEQQIFQTAKVIQSWRSEKRDKGLLTVQLKRSETREEKTLNMEISAMIGIGLYQLQFANNDELDITRRKMVAVRRNAVESRDPTHYSMEPELDFISLPPKIKEMHPDNKILVRVYYKLCEQTGKGSYQTIQVDMNTSADDFTTMVIPEGEAKRERYGIPDDCDIGRVVLKLAGQSSYVHGHWDLIQFAPIIKRLIKRREIELTLVWKLEPSLDEPRGIEDWNLVDEAIGLTGTHSDLSALSKEHTQVFTMSTWDIQKKLRIRVVGLDNLFGTELEVVYVEAGIYHGGELLGYSRFTTEVGSCTYPRWNQWLVFDTTVKHLPKAARLCLQVIGGSRAKDSKKKSLRKRSSLGNQGLKGSEGSQDKPLHWVNLQILDHRSLLRQGLLRLNLWPAVVDPNTGEPNMSPMGSTALNPDGNNSAVLYIEFDTYAHPVAFPTGGWGQDTPVTPDPSSRELSMFEADLTRAIRADPLRLLDRSEVELIWKFRNHCSTIPEALPKLLRCIEWDNLDKVLEVHRLLDSWRPITMEVALELLDYHFADEKVRSLAVRRLGKLANDELQNFLLQLVQVLKFEPYHDSALVRFLLSRALQSKKIGHYFYWYLRSEMDTPQFNQRFGILLEAYLRGCGEAMFQEIRNQHTAVCKLMEVAANVKKQTEKFKGASALAKEFLVKYELPQSFSPPYDPSLQMGSLSVDRCRAMDSKKQPLWLEFQNMDQTALSNQPIKVIAKHGDDLRQDMLTLQMLALMDKMWNAQGLDLQIIAYGCISTGNEMGMIEVVQNADTVAKIQLAHGGTFSTLKDEPLYEWLKKHNPTPSKLEAAVEKFMLSCAGYCVATYVLGIGDRHNDNVMVTTSGNLFHIDFGHFLGNTKSIMGVKRERAPFVLTPDFEFVLGKRGSETFKRFEETAVRAYMIIRKNANIFINLFSMMKCTGIPELRSVEDLEYLRSVLVLDRTDSQAEEHFKSEIQRCLRLQWSTQLNWFTHNVVHRQS